MYCQSYMSLNVSLIVKPGESMFRQAFLSLNVSQIINQREYVPPIVHEPEC